MDTSHVMTAYLLAREKHLGQPYGNEPYIHHCIRVASGFRVAGMVIAALLHDTVEDTDLTIGEIDSLFGRNVSAIVYRLTRNKSTTYREYIENVGLNPAATKIKLADLNDHLTNGTPEKLASLRGRYESAKAYLLSKGY